MITRLLVMTDFGDLDEVWWPWPVDFSE